MNVTCECNKKVQRGLKDIDTEISSLKLTQNVLSQDLRVHNTKFKGA